MLIQEGKEINYKVKKAIIAINSILLIIIILFAPFSFYVFNFKFYEKLYERNDVYKTLDRNDVAILTTSVFNFLKYGEDFKRFELKNNLNYFTDNEISHLMDVKILFDKILVLLYSSIILIIILTLFLLEKNILGFLRSISSFFVIATSIIIFLLVILYFLGNNFGSLFENMHLVLFPGGNWAFPEGSLLITLLPFGFFYDFFIRLLSTSFIISIIIIIIGIIGLIFTGRQRKWIEKKYKK
jgi:integral membrane protein (TIGR01906 family)